MDHKQDRADDAERAGGEQFDDPRPDGAAALLKDAVGRGLKPYLDAQGRLCIGKDCFIIRLDADEVRVIANPNSKKRSREDKKFIAEMRKKVAAGAGTVYEIPKAEDDE